MFHQTPNLSSKANEKELYYDDPWVPSNSGCFMILGKKKIFLSSKDNMQCHTTSGSQPIRNQYYPRKVVQGRGTTCGSPYHHHCTTTRCQGCSGFSLPKYLFNGKSVIFFHLVSIQSNHSHYYCITITQMKSSMLLGYFTERWWPKPFSKFTSKPSPATCPLIHWVNFGNKLELFFVNQICNRNGRETPQKSFCKEWYTAW